MKRIVQIVIVAILVSMMGTVAFARSHKSDDGGGYNTQPQRRDTLALVTPTDLQKAERLAAKKFPNYIPYIASWCGEWERDDRFYHRKYVKAEDLKHFGYNINRTENEGSVHWMTLKLMMNGEIVAYHADSNWDHKRTTIGKWWPRK